MTIGAYRITKAGERTPVIDENRNLRVDVIRAPATAGIDRDGDPYSGIQGSTYGFTAGGLTNNWSGAPSPPPSPVVQNIIDRFPFGNFTTATDVGDLTVVKYGTAGQSSSTHGYASGGFSPATNAIQKYPFAQSSGTASNVGTLTVARRVGAGTHSQTHGYSSAGSLSTSPWTSNVIDKFPFASDGASSDVGDATYAGYLKSGQSSVTHGYSAGYFSNGNVIEKHSFSSDGNATDVGDLQHGKGRLSGQSSTTDGYASGYESNSISNMHIQKFPFASDANAVVVGHGGYGAPYNRNTIGQSSTTDGHISGGEYGPPPGTYTSLFADYNVVHRFPFAISSGAATDVGDLTQARNQASGNQV